MSSRYCTLIVCILVNALGWSSKSEAQAPAISELPKSTECSAKAPYVTAGGAALPSTIRVSSKGGWCWLNMSATTQGGMVYAPMYTVSRAPAHGELLMGEVSQKTRIAYKPTAGFTGNDSFVIVNKTSNSERAVSVTVVP